MKLYLSFFFFFPKQENNPPAVAPRMKRESALWELSKGYVNHHDSSAHLKLL